MNATTIKLENPLLKSLLHVVPKKKSLTAFVREVLESEVQRRRMSEAGEAYLRFLEANPEEKKWLEEWETSDLGSSPKPSKRKNKS